MADGSLKTVPVTDYACALYRRRVRPDAIPPAFVSASDIDPHAHLAMQAALQPHVDNAISKTVSVPADYDFALFQALYEQAYDLGLKGCTTYRPAMVRGSVMQAGTAADDAVQCCSVEREAD